MAKQTDSNTAPIRKKSKARRNPRTMPEAIGASDIPKGKSLPVKVPQSLDDIRMSTRGKTVAEFIRSEQTKLVKHAESIIKGYCEIGRALQIAKDAVESAKGSWKKFMDEKPLGIAYSTAERYIIAHRVGADVLIGEAEKLGGTLNFKDALAAAQIQDRMSKGKPRDNDAQRYAGLMGKKQAPEQRAPQPASNVEPNKGSDASGHADTPNASGKLADLPALSPRTIADELVNSIVTNDVPRMTKSQAQRVLLAVETHLADLAEAIEGESEAA